MTPQIERLMRTAETGEQWAEICRLEAEEIAIITAIDAPAKGWRRTFLAMAPHWRERLRDDGGSGV